MAYYFTNKATFRQQNKTFYTFRCRNFLALGSIVYLQMTNVHYNLSHGQVYYFWAC